MSLLSNKWSKDHHTPFNCYLH